MVIAKHVILSEVEESPVCSNGRAAEAFTSPFARICLPQAGAWFARRRPQHDGQRRRVTDAFRRWLLKIMSF